jgi:hypothetical protein
LPASSSPWWWRNQSSSTRPHSAISQKTVIFNGTYNSLHHIQGLTLCLPEDIVCLNHR